ncbi:MAG TPA: MotA/TolQ/ExbB proton channel family protein [Phycisphaerae bacterium]|nr:MotA/TolQ/ExbB proton channel family protein [Phycisphaerae bacterium]HRY69758.1 MotA/TolQ/ExbB proton channel family protein [Phycisphaerae bacterium]HSA29234.1 MotA/TolQ/ExbB proton channel family protein [Phycisphaerae bacterium]
MIDRATMVGLLATLALLGWVIVSGTNWDVWAFISPASIAMVVGGAVLTTLMSFPAAGFRSFVQVARNAFVVRTRLPEESVVLLAALAEIARRDGLLALERPVAGLNDEFLKQSMRMAIDGFDASTIESVCRAEMESSELRHHRGIRLIESTARSAPVFGMIGTVTGLIIMLGRMKDPASIGPGMAIALLTTLYGLVLANVLCWPLARKLAHRSEEESLVKMIVLKGVLAIQMGDNPRTVEQKLRAYLPPGVLATGPSGRSAVTGRVLRSLAEARRARGAEPRGISPEKVEPVEAVAPPVAVPSAVEKPGAESATVTEQGLPEEWTAGQWASLLGSWGPGEYELTPVDESATSTSGSANRPRPSSPAGRASGSSAKPGFEEAA